MKKPKQRIITLHVTQLGDDNRFWLERPRMSVPDYIKGKVKGTAMLVNGVPCRGVAVRWNRMIFKDNGRVVHYLSYNYGQHVWNSYFTKMTVKIRRRRKRAGTSRQLSCKGKHSGKKGR